MNSKTTLRLSLFALCAFTMNVAFSQLTSITPSKGNRGQTIPIIISGSPGNFSSQGTGTIISLWSVQGSSIIGPGSTNQGTVVGDIANVQVVSSSVVHADVTIPGSTTLGMYSLYAHSQGVTHTLPSSFEVLQGSSTGVSMKVGGGKPGDLVSETFDWNNIDLTGKTITKMWLSKNGNTIVSLNNIQIVQKKSKTEVDIQIPTSAEQGYWKVNMITADGNLLESPAAFLIDHQFSITDHDLVNMKFYPNPASEFIKIEFNDVVDENISVRILDINGRFVSEQLLEKGVANYRIDVTELVNGMYFMQLLNNQVVITSKKLIKN